MLTFKLIEIVEGFYRYEIYPEGNLGDVQTIIFDPIRKIKKFSSFSSENEKYLGHFTQGLRDKNGNLRTEGMVAWG